jgi:N-acetylmuramoyl-L-alanine amidase
MKARFIRLIGGTAVAAGALLCPLDASAQTARTQYASAQAAEARARLAFDSLSPTAPAPEAARVAEELREVMTSYETLVRRYPASAYSDNALFNAAVLADALHQRFGDARDGQRALRLYRRVAAEYPSSSLTRQLSPVVARLERASRLTERALPASGPERARLVSIDRAVLPEAVRITLALDREVIYREETLSGPARVFFDLKGVELGPDLRDAVLRYPSDIVRQIRVGRHPDHTVRVVLDLDGVARHSVYALYNPFRLVIDAEPAMAAVSDSGATLLDSRTSPVAPEAKVPPSTAGPLPKGRDFSAAATTTPETPEREGSAVAIAPAAPVAPIASRVITPVGSPTVAPPVAPPAAPKANGAGGFSIARQLGLGVSRIVIDPGHGGHDPGALGRGLSEAAVTLDVALRLEKLLQKESGIEVVLTRRDDVYVPLEERTAIANREDADLFLSIHANASRNTAARGVETYFLSFAATAEAEAVAARENSAHAGEMRNLPNIIKAITLNNKLDESRDLAAMVQEAMVTRLQRSNKTVRSLGVKKAPFVVLIGAEMPSVLAEVSFLTNKQELQLLKTASYKQRIAEALHAAVLRYRRSLKGQGAVASQ